MVPSVPSPGNHEYERPESPPAAEGGQGGRAEPANAELSRHWRPQFTLPENGPEGLKESVYYVDYQGTRIISLNSNEGQEAQVAWLEKVLGDNPGTWTVITFHHPIYSSAKDRDNPKLRALWQPVFDRFKVDLVLQGHDHTYGRSGLRVSDNVPEGVSQRDGGGTVYVVSVSGPKMYRLNDGTWRRRSAEDTQLYQIIVIDGNTLTYEARTAVGDLYDRFELRKTAGRPNELIEGIPATPERRFPVPSEAEAKSDGGATGQPAGPAASPTRDAPAVPRSR
jgi:3',5'-cyclic AMP phosphodiesterase CpdA